MSEKYRSRAERRQVQNNNTKKTKKKEKKTSFFRKFLIACLIIGIICLVAGVSAFFIIIKDAPELDEAKLVNPLSTKFYDKDGEFIYEYGAEKRTNITYDQIPKVVEEAFIATEDSRFYEHHGIDFKRTAKAIFENITGGFGSQGGSTITQQVVKNYFLTPDKTLKRKVQEWYLAYQLEQEYSKQEILEMYLNKINLGNRSYGIAAAAKNYYNKDVEDLELHEAAMLAGLPQSPNNYDPTIPENVEAATERRNTVLDLMVRHGYITEKEAEDAKKIPVTEGLQPHQELEEMPYQAFLDAAVKEVEAELDDVNIGSDGLQIYTTLDTDAQDYADQLLNTEEIINYPNEQFQGSFVFMDTSTGEVRALGSGRGEHEATFKGHNQAIEMDKQVGSVMKPIFAYGPAIEYLKWSTGHQLKDEPYKYKDNGQLVSNAGRGYQGNMSMRKAVEQSYNVPAIKTVNEVGLDKAQTFAEGLGITFEEGEVVESTPLGVNASSPLEIAGAYAAFGNNGVYNKPHFVKEVVYPDGKKVDFTPPEKRVMKDYTAYMITDMLRDVVDKGTGTKANVPSLDVAGKTGTTNFDEATLRKYNYPSSAVPDSWFAGYTPQYTMAVWTGYNNYADGYISSTQTGIASQIFKSMMTKFGTDKSSFTQPSSVYRENGELYIKGAKKDVVNKPEVDPPTGFTAAYDDASKSVNLKWSPSSDKGVSYGLSYTATDGSGGSIPVNGTSATLSSIKPGVTYTFSLVAKKDNGTSKAVTQSVTSSGQSDAEKAEEEAKEAARKKAEKEAEEAAEAARKKAEEEAQKPQPPNQDNQNGNHNGNQNGDQNGNGNGNGNGNQTPNPPANNGGNGNDGGQDGGDVTTPTPPAENSESSSEQ